MERREFFLINRISDYNPGFLLKTESGAFMWQSFHASPLEEIQPTRFNTVDEAQAQIDQLPEGIYEVRKFFAVSR